MSKPELLIIGKIPPPIGGVTIHVQRLCVRLEKISYPFIFCNLSIKNILVILRKISFVKTVHLHASNPYVRLFLAIYCRLLSKKILITYHGNLGRFSRFKNMVDIFSVKLVSIPIVLNRNSFVKVFSVNKNTRLISAFIPPDINRSLVDLETEEKIYSFSGRYSIIFSTNAFNVTFDLKGNEIYGISQLVAVFSEIPDKGLIISDPSGHYKRYLQRIFNPFPKNILILDYPHDFIIVIMHSDVVVRATTTDGDSLSVKEALFFKKWVIASDCVNRPNGVVLYKTGDRNDLSQTINKILPNSKPVPGNEIIDGFSELISLYVSF